MVVENSTGIDIENWEIWVYSRWWR